jgi:hypothetical protein
VLGHSLTERLMTKNERRDFFFPHGVSGAGWEHFFVMKVSPERVAMREGKAWRNRHLASGIATRLLLAPFNFLGIARRARKKHLDRWNNVCARRPENIGFWRAHCSTTVACGAVARRKTEMKRSKKECQCLKRNAGKRREFRCGINTHVRLPEQFFCAETRRKAHAKALRRKGDHDEVRSARRGG